jgi:O-antigen ligase
MTSLASDEGLAQPIAVRNHAVPLLQTFAVALMVFPSDLVIKTIGAGGYPAALVAYFAFLAWVAATLFGLHNPLDYRYPVRIALCALWLASLASYALMNRAVLSSTQLLGADRWLLQLACVSGVILVAAECLRSIEDIRRVLRALTWGGAFCGVVAELQFRLSLNITPYLGRLLPGFSLDQAAATTAVIGSRGELNRVFGTATDPIELGVSAGMLLPLALYLAMHDVGRPIWRRWLPVMCIALSVPASVSRSAILAAAMSLGVLIVLLPPHRRLAALAAVPLALAAVFVTAHGLLGTLKTYFLAGTADSSIAHRVNNYPYVEHLVRQAPWFGQGGGTYIIEGIGIHILDNQYLTTAIELGLVGLAALTFFLVWPALAAFSARRRTDDPELRDLCAALAGAALAATICSATFDSLSFPMFVNVQALVAGLIGAAWLLAGRKRAAVLGTRSFREHSNGMVSSRQRAGSAAVEHNGGN